MTSQMTTPIFDDLLTEMSMTWLLADPVDLASGTTERDGAGTEPPAPTNN